MDSAAHKFLVATVTTKHNEAKQSVEKFLQTLFASGDGNARLSAVRDAINAVTVLQGVLHENYRPPWLAQILSSLRRFEKQHQQDNGFQAAKLVATSIYPEMAAHQWAFEDVRATGFDFDAIYENARDSNSISELFDEIINCLQQIVDSEEIDSVRMLKELESLIATLKNARRGSYLAVRGAWYFLVEWMKNTGWEVFGDIPVIGAAVRGLKTTMEKANTAMVQMHDDVYTQSLATMKTELPRLMYVPPDLPKADVADSDKTT